MKIAYLDSIEKDIIHFENIIKTIPDISKLDTFTNTADLLNFLASEAVDFAFIGLPSDTREIPKIAAFIREVSPTTDIVFVSENNDYAVPAFELGIKGYVLKPCQKEKILIPLNLIPANTPRIHIRTFGHFDLFIDNTVVMFSNKKAKEMLALLTDKHGGSLDMEQIIDVLWEDRPYNESTKALYRIALKDLRDTLKKHNCQHILVESKRQRSLDITKFSCDYYDYLKNEDSSSVFSGEYMTNYSWGEYTLAKLMKKFYISQ